MFDILNRHGMVPKKRRRRAIGHPGRPTSQVLAPNDLWCADFKGQFKTGDGIYCYPLTVTDEHSRYLLGCQGLLSTRVAEAKPVFTRLFKEYGLPKRIRTDNGVPFATNTLARLSRLSAWWVRLGVLPELIEPGKPQQNGRHERMHRTLKAETTRPPAESCRAQQRKFNRFREEFNHERPHEALDMHTPASCYEPSPREMPTKLPPLEYPDRFEVRYVSANGGIRWKKHAWVNVSTVCVGEYVGLEEIDDGVWDVYFGPLQARAPARAAHAHRGCLRSAAAAQRAANDRWLRPITMPRADQRLRYASSPISASRSPSTEEKPAFGAEICQACPRTLLSTISPTAQVASSRPNSAASSTAAVYRARRLRSMTMTSLSQSMVCFGVSSGSPSISEFSLAK